MAIRMTGLQSGLDTEKIVEQLMEAQKTKKTKIENKKTKAEWKQEIWKSLNTKINSFHTTWASKMRFQTSYKAKKAVSSNENKLTATGNSNAVNGSYSVKINKLATTQYVTGGQITASLKNAEGKDVKVSTSTKLSDLVAASGDTFKDGAEIAIKNGDKSTTLVVDSETTIGDLINSYKSVGLTASFDTKQNRIFVSAAETGENGKFTITTTQSSDDVVQTRKNMWDAVGYPNLSTKDKNSVNKALLSYATSDDEEVRQEALKTLQEIAEKNAIEMTTTEKKAELAANELAKYVQEEDDGSGNMVQVFNPTDDAELEAELKKFAKTSEKMSDADYNTLVNEDKVALAKKMAEKRAAEQVQTDEVKAEILQDVNGADGSLEAARNSLIAGLADAYDLAEDANTATSSDILKVVGMADVTGDEVAESATSTGMAVIGAQDSEVVVNGATLKNSSNTVEVNGLTLELKDTTAIGETISLTVSNDTDAMYDMVKDFLKEYNALLKEMNTMYYADRAKDYEPLTDEQKEEMSDDEIEKWEQKIKDSLLRRDDSLQSVINIMKNSMMGSVEVDGKRYSLATLGIMTSTDYTEKGLLHIYGDTEDAVYADKDNKLQNFIDNDPDLVMNILTGLTSNLYTGVQKLQQANEMKSYMSYYNDKQMTKQIDDYKKEISKWEQKLKDMEDRYYKQFTAMEKALASMQSQQSALSGLMG